MVFLTTMEFSDIAAAIDCLPSKKEDLRKAFVALQSLSSSLPDFTLQWKDLDDHFSSIEKSIRKRFREIKAEEKLSPPKNHPSAPLEAEEDENEEVEPRPELKSLAAKMYGKGLRSYISEHRKDIQAIRRELGPALRAAPDPAALVLDSLDGFFSSKGRHDSEVLSIQRTCASLLDCLLRVDPEIRPSVRERAKPLAVEWKGRIDDGEFEDYLFVVLAFLQFVAMFGLVGSFDINEILDLLVLCARMKQAVDLSRRLGLQDKMPVFVNKLHSKGKQLDAVKFVVEFNLLDDHTPASLLNEYVKESKKVAKDVQKKGNYSLQSQNVATDKEMAAIKTVIKTVEEFKLDSVYPLGKLHERIEQLEKIKAERKRTAVAAATNSNAKGQKQSNHQTNKQGQKQHNHQPNKRFRPSAPISVPMTHQQPQLGLVDPISYMGLPGYGLAAAPALHHHGVASLSGNPVGFGGPHAQLRSYLYL